MITASRNLVWWLAGGPAPQRLCAALLCTLLAALGPSVDPAGAVGQFGSYGSQAGQLSEPNGIAVDQETGDVYIVDTNNERLEKYSKEGEFLLASGWGVRDGRTQAPQTCTAATGCFPGSSGPGAGQLAFAEGVAVDNDPSSSSHHDLYVADISNARVEKFSPSGRFLLMFGGQVNETAQRNGDKADEDVCPVKPGDRCRAGTPGYSPGQFDFRVEGNFISVGPNGTVYVGVDNGVREFSAAGVYRSQVAFVPSVEGGGEGGGTIALAVDSAGDIYAIRFGIGGVQKYTPWGQLQLTLNEEAEPEHIEGPTPNMALGPAGQVFLDGLASGEHQMLDFDSSGPALARFDIGMEDGLHGLVYSDVTGELYIVGAKSSRIRVITPPQVAGPVFSSFSVLPWLLAR